ncbi:MAG: bifunctional adenosylcobinamide kinase/adenosylcobinamide-phosphate guanylyltransferase [Bacteroidales bacterium]|nr:bifunctional adenosylcobinamide kinase/adenosylcobinamide-phosphate guanylyltransferase [Bacteroidales bacterium]
MAAGEQAVYMATLRIWDEEFAHRVQLHKERRVPQWINLEEEKYLGEPVCINMVWIKKRQPSKNAASFYVCCLRIFPLCYMYFFPGRCGRRVPQ